MLKIFKTVAVAAALGLSMAVDAREMKLDCGGMDQPVCPDGNPYCDPGLDGSTGTCLPIKGKGNGGGGGGGKGKKDCGAENERVCPDGNPYCDPGLDGSTGTCLPIKGKGNGGGGGGGKGKKDCGAENERVCPDGDPYWCEPHKGLDGRSGKCLKKH